MWPMRIVRACLVMVDAQYPNSTVTSMLWSFHYGISGGSHHGRVDPLQASRASSKRVRLQSPMKCSRSSRAAGQGGLRLIEKPTRLVVRRGSAARSGNSWARYVWARLARSICRRFLSLARPGVLALALSGSSCSKASSELPVHDVHTVAVRTYTVMSSFQCVLASAGPRLLRILHQCGAGSGQAFAIRRRRKAFCKQRSSTTSSHRTQRGG